MEALQQLRAMGDQMFQRGSLMSLWQEIAENFYPERADFTATRSLGTDFASNLMTSFPIIVRRDLGNAFGAMLRPDSKEWFHQRTNWPDREDTAARQYLEWLEGIQRRAMYDPIAQLQRATKEADNDFASFGQCVIYGDLHRPLDGSTPHLSHQTHHLRDCAWAQNRTGKVETMVRNEEMFAIDMVRTFPRTVHPDVKEKIEKDPYAKVKCRHIVLPRDVYDGMDGAKKIRQKFVSVWMDIEHDHHELELVGQNLFKYIVARWQTVSGSQYAHSPATVAALPDARLLQAVTRVLLEAGEKAVNPPMIGVREAIKSDLELFAGGFTAVDAEYDERMGEVLKPITQDTKNLTFGETLAKDIREQLTSAFMLNKLNLPPSQGGDKMTAYEVAQRLQEFIRNALPLFGPMEADYNGQLCELDLQLLREGDPSIDQSRPDSIKGAEIRFVFESPLKDALDKQKQQQFTEAAQILAQAQAVDQTAAVIMNGKVVVRDVMQATVPARWLLTEDEVDKKIDAIQAQQAQERMLELMQKGAGIAKDLGTGLNQGSQAAVGPGVATAAA